VIATPLQKYIYTPSPARRERAGERGREMVAQFNFYTLSLTLSHKWARGYSFVV